MVKLRRRFLMPLIDVQLDLLVGFVKFAGLAARFHFTDDFLQTKLEVVAEVMAHLRVWEEPDNDAFYSIGADPAYGSSAWADRSAIEVYRCYADRFEQVAEFCTAEITTYKFAWVPSRTCRSALRSTGAEWTCGRISYLIS